MIRWGTECFTDADNKTGMSLYKFAQTAEIVKNTVSSAPDGSRFFIYGQWISNDQAHVFIAEKIGGMVYYVDPQNGKMDCSGNFNRMKDFEFGICRVDDKTITKRKALIRNAVRGVDNDDEGS